MRARLVAALAGGLVAGLGVGAVGATAVWQSSAEARIDACVTALEEGEKITSYVSQLAQRLGEQDYATVMHMLENPPENDYYIYAPECRGEN